ncbi:hypothetical protein B7P43_G15787 [Cryptotermes secundus]|uniref:Endonuclease/exonuclease/phosphatase domain-containing protein n=1 Tax=Cryptotermes secundus TaxID=105785 RepID=A0A2J7PRG8_9NEOP|nr:hypothetical protein B7P43_G15787 [Cryptotermes secundus]
MRYGAWIVRSMYRACSLRAVTEEISICKLDLVGVQEATWDGGGTEPAGKCTFFYGKGNENHEVGTGFCVHKGIISAVKRAEFYMFYGDLDCVFDKFPKYPVKILLGDFNAKVGREDIFKQTVGNERSHKISNNNGVRVVNFVISKNLAVKSTTFPHRKIHKFAWTSPDGKTHSQVDRISGMKREYLEDKIDELGTNSKNKNISGLNSVVNDFKEYSEMVHKLFIEFKKAYDPVRRKVLYNIVIEFGVPMKVLFC